MKRVLIMKLRHHGDVLLTSPLMHALARHNTPYEVHVLLYAETCPMLFNNPDVAKIWTIDRKVKGWARWQAFWRLVKALRALQFDTVLVLTDQWEAALLAALCKARFKPQNRIGLAHPKRLGCNNPMTGKLSLAGKLWRHLVPILVPTPPRGTVHAVHINMLVLPAMGIYASENSAQLILVPSADAQIHALQLLQAAGHSSHKGYVVAHPAARWPFKCWNDGRFAKVLAGILRRGFDVVLSSSPSPQEMQMTVQIAKMTHDALYRKPIGATEQYGKLLNLAGQTRLEVLTALLADAKAYFGVDSAPMHMAAALNVPQVALFGPSWVGEWRPYHQPFDETLPGTKTLHTQVLWAGDFAPLPHPDAINTDDPTRLLEAIPFEVVNDAMQKLLDGVELSAS